MDHTRILLSQAEAAALLRVDRTTIWRLVKRGDLLQIKIGRRALILKSSIDDFIAAQLDTQPGDVAEV